MRSIGVGVYGDVEGVGKNLGKLGTSSDITFYNYKKDEDAVFFLEPTKYPEKITPLLYCINLTDYALVFVDEIRKELGETLLALDMMGVKKGAFVIGEYVDVEQLKNIVSNTSMKDFDIREKDFIKIREDMMALPQDVAGETDLSYTSVPIDHFFTVKSVGLVVLGRVKKGIVKVHDNLRLYPTEKTIMVKSIQIHDRDYTEAPTFSRVGVALKGVAPEELERGMVLSNGDLKVSTEFTLNMKWNPYIDKEVGVGEDYQINIGLQTISCKVMGKEGNKITLKLIKSVVYELGDRAVLLDGSAKIRILGVSELK